MKNSSRSAYAKHNQLHRLRQQIAVESARLMSEEGINNFKHAREKAAQHFGIQNEHAYPDNEEILTQLKIHQSLYQSTTHDKLIHDLREKALNAMKFFHDYTPRLTGSVLLGHANQHSGIDILVMADSPEEIAIQLIKHEIPYQLSEWKLYFNKRKPQLVPNYRFYAGEHQINLIVLSENQRKVVPLSPMNGQPMQRASIKQVEALLIT